MIDQPVRMFRRGLEVVAIAATLAAGPVVA